MAPKRSGQLCDDHCSSSVEGVRHANATEEPPVTNDKIDMRAFLERGSNA